MLVILSTVFGFLAPFLPEVLKWFTRKQDNAHELAMMEMRLKAGAQEHLWRMEEINANADIAEMKALHAPQPSLGVKLLDAAAGKFPSWVVVPAFWAFAFLDWFTGMVRPAITCAMVAFYMLYRIARFEMMRAVVSDDTSVWQMIAASWGENDWAMLFLVLSFWFGQRSAKQAFGWGQTR